MKTDNTHRLSNGKRLGYAEFGDPKGKPLFTFHGWPSSRLQGEVYDNVCRKLGIRVISTDRPGFGLSDYDPYRTLLDWPDTVLELADALKLKKFSVMGISGGGPYAAVCAYKIPGRLDKTGIVVGLAPTYIPGVLNGMPPLAKFMWQNYGRVPFFPMIAAVFYNTLSHMSPHLGIYGKLFGAKSDKTIFQSKKARDEMRRYTREAFRTGPRGPALDLVLYTHPWGFDLSETKKQVYLWYGEDDVNVPVGAGNVYHAAFPKNTYIVFPGEGHMILRTHTKEILQKFVA